VKVSVSNFKVDKWKLGQRFLRFFTFFWHDIQKT